MLSKLLHDYKFLLVSLMLYIAANKVIYVLSIFSLSLFILLFSSLKTEVILELVISGREVEIVCWAPCRYRNCYSQGVIGFPSPCTKIWALVTEVRERDPSGSCLLE